MSRALLSALLALALLPAAAHAAEISEGEAVRIADRDAKVVELRRENGGLSHTASIVDGNWEVAYFAAGEQVALVLVDPRSGEVRESWTGHQVLWKMARGYSGAFGHKLNAPYVFLPLCALFLLGLLTGLAVPAMRNPRMGVASHLQGMTNGPFLVVAGLLWPRLDLPATLEVVAVVVLVYGTYANWLATQLGALWGAGRRFAPGAAGEHRAPPGRELVVDAPLARSRNASMTRSTPPTTGAAGSKPR